MYARYMETGNIWRDERDKVRVDPLNVIFDSVRVSLSDIPATRQLNVYMISPPCPVHHLYITLVTCVT